MTLTEQQIKEIAENLDMGMRCFYHLKSGEIKSVFYFDDDYEDLIDEYNAIEENINDYFEFEKLSSRDYFTIMADFTDTFDNKELQNELVKALNKPKPFSNFKWQIDNSGEYRQKWFDYKEMRYIEWVKEQIEHFNK